MSSNPINLGLRFLLEICALLAMGVWGWQKGDGWLGFALAIGIPIVAAAVWGTFRVPNDPGSAPIAVPGILRLTLEVVFFTFAAWALQDARYTTLAWVLGITLVLHYSFSYDRILWLIHQ